MADASTTYTRAGSLQIDKDGQLVKVGFGMLNNGWLVILMAMAKMIWLKLSPMAV
jgi:flagellar basal body rod protein FlgG